VILPEPRDGGSTLPAESRGSSPRRIAAAAAGAARHSSLRRHRAAFPPREPRGRSRRAGRRRERRPMCWPLLAARGRPSISVRPTRCERRSRRGVPGSGRDRRHPPGGGPGETPVAPAATKASRPLLGLRAGGQGPALDRSGDARPQAESLRAIGVGQAIRGLARTQGRAGRSRWRRAGLAGGGPPQAAAAGDLRCPWGDIRQAAADVLPLRKGRGGEKLPPSPNSSSESGSVEKGKAAFAGVGTCAKCHVVQGEGKMVGPDPLQELAQKLCAEALMRRSSPLRRRSATTTRPWTAR
jgi:cytochrome c553